MDRWGAQLYEDPCRECGFTWASGLEPLTAWMRRLPDALEEVVARATGDERLPDLDWNVSAYVAHMADNTSIWAERLIAVARGADAHVTAYDPDLLATARRYNDIALEGSRWSLRLAVDRWLDAVREADDADVVVLHAERGEMQLSNVVASNVHDAHHHLWDLERILR